MNLTFLRKVRTTLQTSLFYTLTLTFQKFTQSQYAPQYICVVNMMKDMILIEIRLDMQKRTDALLQKLQNMYFVVRMICCRRFCSSHNLLCMCFQSSHGSSIFTLSLKRIYAQNHDFLLLLPYSLTQSTFFFFFLKYYFLSIN